MNWIDQWVKGWTSTSIRPSLRHDCLMKLKLELGSFGHSEKRPEGSHVM